MLTYDVTDAAGNGAARATRTVTVEDTTAPSNPTNTALGYSTAATVSADLTSGEWYNYPTPKFTWDEGADDPASGQSSSGIDFYHTLLTTDNTASPSAETGDACYYRERNRGFPRQMVIRFE